MRFLITGDIHYSLKQYDWLLEMAPKFDAIVIAGDLLEIASAVDPGAQVVVVRTYLRKLAGLTRVIACSGNHDLTSQSAGGERMAGWLGEIGRADIAVDGMCVPLGEAVVSVFPWWDGPEGVATIASQLANDAPADGTPWIWVYHAPPGDSGTSWNGARSYGDPELGKWIAQYKPYAVFCGHIHQAPFVSGGTWADRLGSSWIFNMGQQPGEVPAHIVLDTGTQTAFWHSLAGFEELLLHSADARPAPSTTPPVWLIA